MATLKKRKKITKPVVTLTPLLFELLIKYMLSEDTSTMAFYSKLDIFFHSVNTTHYEEDGDLVIPYTIVKELLRMILVENIKDPNILVDRITTHFNSGDEYTEVLIPILEELEEKPLDKTTAVYIENEFINRLNYISIVPLVETLRSSIHKLDGHDYETYGDIVDIINKEATNISKAIISKSSVSVTLPDVSFDNSIEFRSIADNARKHINDEKRVIKTGLKRLNRFLNGGWQPGRVYLSNAISGGGKSVFLLNAAIWACKYNDDVVCLDRTKQPAVLYITQENDIEETFDRIFSYTNSRDDEGKIIPMEEVIEDLKENKLLDSKWTLLLRYRPKHTLSTMDIDNIISEIEAEGNVEIKFLVHDYIKRLKPDNPMGDIRLDLGACVDDLSILAKRRKIPILTANQLNREAYRMLNETSKKDDSRKRRSDHGKKLDVSMISESQLMVENTDVAFGCHMEEGSDGTFYFTFKKFKDRASRKNRTTLMDYFVHEFEEGNGMRLKEDYGTEFSYSHTSIESRFGTDLDDVDEDADVFEEE